MMKFNYRYATDEGFRDFIDATNLDEVLYEFGYELFLKYKENTSSLTGMLVNPKIVDINNILEYFEKLGEFEKCQALLEIKKKM